MANIDFPTSPANGALFTPATGVTYRYVSPPGIWTVANGPADTVISSDTPPADAVPNQFWFNSALGQTFIYYNDGNTTQWVPANPTTTSGGVVQTVSYQTGAVATGTTTIPVDDTIPQITEGTEFMTLAITPRSATSKLVIDVAFSASSTALVAMAVALFQDSTANALAAVVATIAAANYTNNIRLTHTMTSGTTSATTFRVRAGGNTAGTTTFNGANSARYFGGVMASSIVIQEVAP